MDKPPNKERIDIIHQLWEIDYGRYCRGELAAEPSDQAIGLLGNMRDLFAYIDALAQERDALQAKNGQLSIACANVAGLRIAYTDIEGVSCDDFETLLQTVAEQAREALVPNEAAEQVEEKGDGCSTRA